MEEIRHSLSEEEFKLLVEGKEVIIVSRDINQPTVKIIIQDIGWDRMRGIINEAEFPSDKYGKHEKITWA